MKNKGFTLVEMLVVVAIIGILASIGSISFLGVLRRTQLNDSISRATIILKDAQSKARQEKRSIYACFKSDAGYFLGRVSSAAAVDIPCSGGNWESLGRVRFDPLGAYRSVNGAVAVGFSYKGLPTDMNFDGVNLVVSHSLDGDVRCVRVATLLGALNQGDNRLVCR